MMITSKWRLPLTLLFGSVTLAAEVGFAGPSGSVTNLIVGDTNVIWDVSQFSGLQNIGMAVSYNSFLTSVTNSGTNYFSQNYSNEVDVSYASSFIQDGRGRFTGSGTNDVSLSYYDITNQFSAVFSTNFPGKYATSGSVISQSGVAKFLFTSKASGQAAFSDKTRRVSVSQQYLVFIYANGRSFRGSYANIVNLSGSHTLAQGGVFPASPLPAQMGDGRWTLLTNFEQPASGPSSKLKGTAIVTLYSGAIYPFRFTGSYSDTKHQSSLLLKGVKTDVGDGRGSTLLVTLSQSNSVARLSGRVCGQNVALK